MQPMKKKQRPLTTRQELFCVNLVERYEQYANASEAFRGAYDCSGKKPTTVGRKAHELMNNPRIIARIEQLRAKFIKKAELKVEDVLEHWKRIVFTDANELVQVRRTCCRHCYGINHARQWTHAEYAMASAKAIQSNKTPPAKPAGGCEFDAKKEPYQECPACFGEGVVDIYLADTRKLSPGARALYAGAKKTRYGIEIRLHDKSNALENIAKFLGMFKDKLNSPIGTPAAPLVSISAVTTDPVEASKIYQQMMGGK